MTKPTVTFGARNFVFGELTDITFEPTAPPTYRLALVRSVTRKDDGAVEMSFGPAPKCERCRHWASGVCARMDDDDSKVHPVADHGYDASVVTDADFGCSLYEPREPAEILTDGPAPDVPAAGPWIPVAERMPATSGRYLVRSSVVGVMVATWDTAHGWGPYGMNGEATHWARIEAPKETE